MDTASNRADAIRDAFLDALRARGATVRTMAKLAERMAEPKLRAVCLGLGRAGREVYFVGGVGFINVHVRSESAGWWGILKSVKNDLDFLSSGHGGEAGVTSYYILLIGRGDHFVAGGYVVSDFSRPPMIKPPSEQATKYTINEKQHLDRSALLLSVDSVAKALVARRLGP